MAAFGAIMQFYDPLRSFPLWGFGGQVGSPLVTHISLPAAAKKSFEEYAPQQPRTQQSLKDLKVDRRRTSER